MPTCKIAGKSFFELWTGSTTERAAPNAQIRPRLVRRASQCKGTAVPSSKKTPICARRCCLSEFDSLVRNLALLRSVALSPCLSEGPFRTLVLGFGSLRGCADSMSSKNPLHFVFEQSFYICVHFSSHFEPCMACLHQFHSLMVGTLGGYHCCVDESLSGGAVAKFA